MLNPVTPPPPTGYDLWDSITMTVAALGSIGVGILAIWGDQIRWRLVGPKLKISLLEESGKLVGVFSSEGKIGEGIWFHLRVLNSRPLSAARNCQVLFTGCAMTSNGETTANRFPVPAAFFWAPAGHHQVGRAVSHEAILDLCSIRCIEAAPEDPNVHLELAYRTSGVPHKLEPHTKTILSLECHADNIARPIKLSVEIEWDGVWYPSPETMASHFKVRLLA